MSNEQIIGTVVAVIAVIIVLSFVKKVIKFAITGAIVIGALLYFNVMTPEQLQDASAVLKENALAASNVLNLSKASENIKFSMEDGYKLQVRINDNWYSTSDIESIVSVSDSYCKAKINGKEYKITDDAVIAVLKLMVKE